MVRPLRVFLCHASQDKPAVRELYHALNAEGWIEPWLDEEKLLGGQDFDLEIYKATRDADAIIICLSRKSVLREGYVNKEIRRALEISQEKTEGAIFVIPLRLDECNPSFEQLRKLHWIDYFTPNAHERLIKSLRSRAEALKIKIPENKLSKSVGQKPNSNLNLRWLGVGGIIIIALLISLFGRNYLSQNDISTSTESPTATEKLSTPTFTKAPTQARLTITPNQSPTIPSATVTDIATPTASAIYEIGATIVSEKDGMILVYVPAGEFTMGSDAGSKSDEKPETKIYLDAFWIDQTEVTNAMYARCVDANQCDAPASSGSFTRSNYFRSSEFRNHPVIYVSWNNALAYCLWVGRKLPTEAEWEKAARGTDARNYPWGNAFPKITLLNYDQSVGDTTEVRKYPAGISFYGAFDMAGNVWEWVGSEYQPYPYIPEDGREDFNSAESRVMRGGSWLVSSTEVRSTHRGKGNSTFTNFSLGFRCALPNP